MECPVCKEPVPPKDENEAYPFCCSRCRLIDLGKWLDEDYKVAGPPVAPSTVAQDRLEDGRYDDDSSSR